MTTTKKANKVNWRMHLSHRAVEMIDALKAESLEKMMVVDDLEKRFLEGATSNAVVEIQSLIAFIQARLMVDHRVILDRLEHSLQQTTCWNNVLVSVLWSSSSSFKTSLLERCGSRLLPFSKTMKPIACLDSTYGPFEGLTLFAEDDRVGFAFCSHRYQPDDLQSWLEVDWPSSSSTHSPCKLCGRFEDLPLEVIEKICLEVLKAEPLKHQRWLALRRLKEVNIVMRNLMDRFEACAYLIAERVWQACIGCIVSDFARHGPHVNAPRIAVEGNRYLHMRVPRSRDDEDFEFDEEFQDPDFDDPMPDDYESIYAFLNLAGPKGIRSSKAGSALNSRYLYFQQRLINLESYFQRTLHHNWANARVFGGRHVKEDDAVDRCLAYSLNTTFNLPAVEPAFIAPDELIINMSLAIALEDMTNSSNIEEGAERAHKFLLPKLRPISDNFGIPADACFDYKQRKCEPRGYPTGTPPWRYRVVWISFEALLGHVLVDMRRIRALIESNEQIRKNYGNILSDANIEKKHKLLVGTVRFETEISGPPQKRQKVDSLRALLH